jgi:hypothetical protein
MLTNAALRSHSNKRAAGRRGQAGLLVVLNLTLVFGALGLAVDLGWARFKRNAAQTAADAAALAGASYAKSNGYTCGAGGVVCGDATACASPNVTPAVNELQVGCLYAGANGFLNTGNQSVTMQANSTAPPGVTGNTPALWVKATVSERPHNLFAGVAGLSAFNVTASSVAGVTATPPAGCIYVLHATLDGAFTINGSASVTAACGIFVNSTSASAFTQTGSSQVHASAILVNGGTALSGSSVVSPTPTTHAGSISDPLSDMTMPTFSGCTHPAPSGNTYYPGVYCGGISLSGSVTTTFSAGLYILNGGGLNISGSGDVNATGVTFFNTGQGYAPSPINASGSGRLNLTAPTSGSYEGMLFIQDRNLTYGSRNYVAGSTSSVYSGTLYFPSTALTFTGSSSGSVTAIVASSVTFNGSSVINNDPTGTLTGLSVRTSSLIQ